MRNDRFILAIIFLGTNPFSLIQPSFAVESATAARTRVGLQAFYDFREAGGGAVRDRSGVGEPIVLFIADPGRAQWGPGWLKVTGETAVQSKEPPEKIVESVRWTGELTVEAWIRPASLDQEGPARIVTLSKNSSQRNFTLGQDRTEIDFRIRTTGTSANGVPSVETEGDELSTELTHVAYTRDQTGRALIYVNGRLTEEGRAGGDVSSWDGTHRLALANEIGGGRPWLGTYYLVAIYNRALLPGEIETHFRAGPDAGPGSGGAVASSGGVFEETIAPILAKRCLECHDAAVKEGGLDLSRRETAMSGGGSGAAIVPGDPDESIAWTMVSVDVMPFLRPSLPQAEKDALREWIANGAEWTVEAIEPSTAHNGGAGEIFVRRLTVPEYIETVRAAAGVEIGDLARELLPVDLRADGFGNTAYNLNVDLKHVEAYAKLAEAIVDRMDVIAFAARFSDSQRLTDKNMRALIAEMGTWLLRGPLTDGEIDLYRGISTTAAASGKNYVEAVSYIAEAMLQSPRFVYRIENQRGDGNPWPVSGYELASRLSYMIWGGPPDRELYRAAESGELYNPAAVKAQTDRMLEDPRAVAQSKRFIAEWLNLDRLDNLRPNPDKFPDWKPALAGDMRDETVAFFADVVWEQNRPLSDLFNAQVTHVTPRLARHYGFEPKEGGGAERYGLSAVPGRGGLLTQGSVLTVGGDEASMVSRGLFVLHDVLRGSVNDPPPCVDTTPKPSEPGLTQRGIAEERVANPACGGCHSRFEPLAYGLEKFDGLGTYRETDEHGNPLREDGEVVFPHTGETVSYETADELMNILARSGRAVETITWKLAQFALGRPPDAGDAAALKAAHAAARADGGTYAATVRAIALSDLVLKKRTEAYP